MAMKIAMDLGLFDKVGLRRSEKVLRILLEAMAQANMGYIQKNKPPGLYESGVYYQTEPRGQENWRGIGQVMAQGHGDCEDLAAWLVAQLRIKGEKATFRLKKSRKPGGFLLYHIQVRRENGKIEDPSRKLGMGQYKPRSRRRISV